MAESKDAARPHAAHTPMVYKTFVPLPPFDSFIENVWYWCGGDPVMPRTRLWRRADSVCWSI
ncbi:MAG: hypothetical protein WDM89_12955 [Rhizomicrobium sp.]